MKPDEIIKKEIEQDMEKINVPSSLYAFANNIKEESRKYDKVTPIVRKKGKKRFMYAAAAVIGFGILSGSVFLNPVMAEIASKIPYLGQVFTKKPVEEVIFETLEEKGYKGLSLSSTPGKVTNYEVQINGTEEDAERERTKVTEIVENILRGRGYDNYQITVTADIPQTTPLTKEERQLADLGVILDKELSAKGFDIIFANPFGTEIEVSIPTTEKRMEEIKAATMEIAEANGVNKGVKFTIEDLEFNERQSLWMEYLNTISEGLAGKKQYMFENYSFSYNDNKISIFIKTTMTQDDPKVKEVVELLRKEIELFLKSDTVRNSKVGTDTYDLHFLDNQSKELNL